MSFTGCFSALPFLPQRVVTVGKRGRCAPSIFISLFIINRGSRSPCHLEISSFQNSSRCTRSSPAAGLSSPSSGSTLPLSSASGSRGWARKESAAVFLFLKWHPNNDALLQLYTLQLESHAGSDWALENSVCGRKTMSSIFPAPVLCARHDTQQSRYSWDSDRQETEGQGGEVTGLKQTELGRDVAMIQITVHFKVPFLILPLLICKCHPFLYQEMLHSIFSLFSKIQ